MKQILEGLLKEYGITFSQQMLDQFEKYYQLVIEENQKINLTSITEKNEFAIKHILDSVLPAKLIFEGASIIDVGAGAGFPSIPLKILRPDIKVTMVDSLNKRVVFLNKVVHALNLSNIEAYHDRAEDFAKKHRESFDIAIARAVAELGTLCEYCLPFVKVGGSFIAMKASKYKEELNGAAKAISVLGGELNNVYLTNITQIQSERANIVIDKISRTDALYPRGKNLPRLKPIK